MVVVRSNRSKVVHVMNWTEEKGWRRWWRRWRWRGLLQVEPPRWKKTRVRFSTIPVINQMLAVKRKQFPMDTPWTLQRQTRRLLVQRTHPHGLKSTTKLQRHRQLQSQQEKSLRAKVKSTTTTPVVQRQQSAAAISLVHLRRRRSRWTHSCSKQL